MERREIYQLLEDAKSAMKPVHEDAATPHTKVSDKAHQQYLKIARRLFGVTSGDKLIYPKDSQRIFNLIRQSKTTSTLRLYARAVRHIALNTLNDQVMQADNAQRQGDWEKVDAIVSQPRFTALIKLASLMPSDYSEDWKPQRKRKGKKASLSKLPADWREQMIKHSSGKFTIPMMIAMLSGARPAEFEKGVKVSLINDSLYVYITGAKVTNKAGQEYRYLKLADHPITTSLIKMMKDEGESTLFVKVSKGNSISTHMRRIGERIWPKRKESITVYTARHAIAGACKQAIAKGSNPDLVSQVLGHIVDKTASYYGNRFQCRGSNILPTVVEVPKAIKRKSAARNANRKLLMTAKIVKNSM